MSISIIFRLCEFVSSRVRSWSDEATRGGHEGTCTRRDDLNAMPRENKHYAESNRSRKSDVKILFKEKIKRCQVHASIQALFCVTWPKTLCLSLFVIYLINNQNDGILVLLAYCYRRTSKSANWRWQNFILQAIVKISFSPFSCAEKKMR